MKKLIKLISLFCLATAFVLASCSSPSSGGNPGGGNGGGRAQVSGKIGKYGAPYVVGDIVFNDGSATPYAEINERTTNPKITDAEKAAAIAVIFYVGTGLNSDVDGNPDNTTVRTLGVGLKQDFGGLAWCASTSVNGYSINITKIQCIPTGSGETLTFSGDKNGSDNLEQISDFLEDEDEDDDTNNLDKYPAFKFGKEYSTEATEGTDYDKSGWYLPSIAELYEIYNEKTTVNAASDLCGGSQFCSLFYWSSSQYAHDCGAYYFCFSDGYWNGRNKDDGSFIVCAVRAFN